MRSNEITTIPGKGLDKRLLATTIISTSEFSTMKCLLLLISTVILSIDAALSENASWPRFQIIGNQLETSEKWHRFGVVAETREYACTRQFPKSSKSECMLRFGELSAINDNGCFMHFDSEKQESIELCPLQCQRFNEATILKSSDSLICSPGVAVGVERRQSDWFMWRSGACRSSDVIFQIECSTSQEGKENEEQMVEVNQEALPMMEEDLPTLKLDSDNGIGEEMDGITTSIEDITSGTSEEATTTTSTQKTVVETSEQEDDLPEKVDTLLGFLFPSYRKKAHH